MRDKRNSCSTEFTRILLEDEVQTVEWRRRTKILCTTFNVAKMAAVL